jgi:transcriptional regulator with XRE-family HTH domain
MLNLHRTEARRDLAAFVRDRRGRTKPQDIGLPAGGRRRTPGLRREEVAQLAGVSVTWYTWFEQGRDIQVSANFLERVSTALRLDTDDRARLLELAHRHGPPPDTVDGSAAAVSLPVAAPRREVPPVGMPGRNVVPMPLAADSESDRINEAIRKVLINEPARATLLDQPADPVQPAKPRASFRLGLGLTLLAAFMLLPY